MPEHDRRHETGELPLAARETLAPPEMGAAPKRIGRYSIKQVIASGGMGTVYLAIQEHPRRSVALKVMKQGLVSSSTLRRFEFESQILARLRHPNIAQVYEAGTHDDGGGRVPYFAMEYVPNARPIAQYVRGQRLGTREILELFVHVCDAVHHGHQKGIIHRDLKPDNILVDSKGEPKIIDFGVARSTGSDVAVTTLQTDVGHLVGTLQYMSPEQCDADPHDLDTRSDVYALGVVFYELLCGRLPYDVSGVAIYEAARVIKEATPARPSTLDRTLRGDLETIALKALEKDRERRYQTPLGLAKDIRRYLKNEPIEARPPSVVYQIRLCARRYRAVFTAAAAVLVVMILATAVSILFAIRAGRAEGEARLAQIDAIRQRDLAVRARNDAQRAKDESDRQRDAAQQQSYIVNLAAASAALEDGVVSMAKRRLERAPVPWRGWEWSHLANVADASLVALPASGSWIHTVGFSGDGGRVVCGSADGAIRVMNSATGEEITTLRGHDGPVYGIACSTNGLYVASASADMTIKVWGLPTGNELNTLRGHDGVVTSVAFSADGLRLVSGSSDTSIRVWDVLAGEALVTIRLEEAAVDCVAFSRDGSTIASGSDDGSVRLWDASTGELLTRLIGHDGFINSVAFTPDGAMLLSASEDRTVRVWATADGDTVHTLHGHAGNVTSVAVSPDGQRIVSGSEDGTTRIWEAHAGREVASLRGHDGGVTSVAFSPDGLRVVSGSEDQTLRIWDATAAAAFGCAAPHDGGATMPGVRSVGFSADGYLIASGADDGAVSLWDVWSGEKLAVLHAHESAVRSLAFSADGRMLATGSEDSSVRLWLLATGVELASLAGHERLVTAVAFSPDSFRLASASWDGLIRIWDTATAEPVMTMGSRDESVSDIAYDPSGTIVATGLTSGGVSLWSTETGERRLTLSGHESAVACVAYSPDGERLATGSHDATIRLWDTSSGTELAILRGHEAPVSDLHFTPDGSRLISGSIDRTIQIWLVESGEQIAALPREDVPIDCLAISRDGTRVVCGSSRGSIRLRDAAPPGDRFQERFEAHFAAITARTIVDRLFDQGLSAEEITARLTGDDGLTETALRAATYRLLSLLNAEGSAEGRGG